MNPPTPRKLRISALKEQLISRHNEWSALDTQIAASGAGTNEMAVNRLADLKREVLETEEELEYLVKDDTVA